MKNIKQDKKELNPSRRSARGLLWGYIFSHPVIYGVGIMTVFITNVMQVVVTRSSGAAIDLIAGRSNSFPFFLRWLANIETSQRQLFTLFWVLLASQILLMLGRISWRLTLARQTHHSSGMLRQKVWKAAAFFPQNVINQEMTKGVLLNAANSDVGSARFLFGFTIVGLTDFLFLTVLALCLMVEIHWQLALWTGFALILLPWLMKSISEKESYYYDKAQNELSLLDDKTAQSVSSFRLQHLTDTHAYWQKQLAEQAELYRLERLKALYCSLRWYPAMGIVNFLCNSILFIPGLWFLFEGKVSVGQFVAFQGLVQLIQEPLNNLGWIISEWRRGMMGLERLQQVYQTPPWPYLETPLQNKKTNLSQDLLLQLDQVSFAFNDSQKKLIENFSVGLKAKERLGIYGAIGSGKTTLIEIMSGLRRDYQGSVLLQGADINQYTHQELRNCMGIVYQRPFLFADSVRRNICMDKTLTDEEIWHYLEVAGMKEDVLQFPHLLDTQLGEWGINLSGGQKQRLTLARSLIRRPKILFLDDCLSAVDTVTEEKILRAMDKELSETTLVWVAHRQSTLKYCHKILEMS